MRHLDPVRTEFLVIGGGAAGMLVAAYLAEHRRDVALVDTGTSCTALSTGCLKGTGLNEAMLDYLLPRLRSNGLSMTRHLEQVPLLGNAGNRYHCSLAPRYTALGTLESVMRSKLAVVGIEDNQDVDPELVCSFLRQDAGMKADPVYISGKGRISLDSLCHELSRIDADSIMLPPLFALRDHESGMLELTERTGRIVFEPVTPLSLPGTRLAEAMRCILANQRMPCPGPSQGDEIDPDRRPLRHGGGADRRHRPGDQFLYPGPGRRERHRSGPYRSQEKR